MPDIGEALIALAWIIGIVALILIGAAFWIGTMV